MAKIMKETIRANGIDIGIYISDFQNEYISITDIARYKSDEPKDVIKNWMRGNILKHVYFQNRICVVG